MIITEKERKELEKQILLYLKMKGKKSTSALHIIFGKNYYVLKEIMNGLHNTGKVRQVVISGGRAWELAE